MSDRCIDFSTIHEQAAGRGNDLIHVTIPSEHGKTVYPCAESQCNFASVRT